MSIDTRKHFQVEKIVKQENVQIAARNVTTKDLPIGGWSADDFFFT